MTLPSSSVFEQSPSGAQLVATLIIRAFCPLNGLLSFSGGHKSSKKKMGNWPRLASSLHH